MTIHGAGGWVGAASEETDTQELLRDISRDIKALLSALGPSSKPRLANSSGQRSHSVGGCGEPAPRSRRPSSAGARARPVKPPTFADHDDHNDVRLARALYTPLRAGHPLSAWQAAASRPAGRVPCYAPVSMPTFDPVGPTPGYDPRDDYRGEPVISHLANSLYPILELCIDALHVSRSSNFLGRAEFEHHVDATRRFLRKGADIEVVEASSGARSLHYAAAAGAQELCEVLLRAKALASARDKKLQTPLMWAIDADDAETCRSLLRFEESVVHLHNTKRMLPLHEAAFHGNTEIVELLLPFHHISGGPDVIGCQFRTPLHVASQEGHFPICVLLIGAFAEPSRACGHGKTPLHYAAELGSHPGLELCMYLAKLRPATRRLRDSSGNTPLDVAKSTGRSSRQLDKILRPTPTIAKLTGGHHRRH